MPMGIIFRSRISVDEIRQHIEKLQRAALSDTRHERLAEMVSAVFQRAIDARSPRNRPPGKAGLRAEKGYFRLLYLEGEYQAAVKTRERMDPETPMGPWGFMDAILRQLKDIPDLQAEILAGIDAALDEVTGRPPRGHGDR
jgi:hypothetical protein